MNKPMTQLLSEFLASEAPKVALDRAQALAALELEADRNLGRASWLFRFSLIVLWIPWAMAHPVFWSDWEPLGSEILLMGVLAFVASGSQFKLPGKPFSVRRRFQRAALLRSLSGIVLAFTAVSLALCLAWHGSDHKDVLTMNGMMLTCVAILLPALDLWKVEEQPLIRKRVLVGIILGSMAPLSWLAVVGMSASHHPPLWLLICLPLLLIPAVLALGFFSWRSALSLARRLDPYWFE